MFKKYLVISILLFIISDKNLYSQTSYILKSEKTNESIKIGAYYFDGWTGTYPYHITSELVKTYSNREPKWGWITSSQEIMDDQIDLAANSGISFFSFCWYYTGEKKFKKEPLNRSLGFYLNAPNLNKLQYTLLIANHGSASVGPDDWPIVCKEWITQFKSATYLKVDGKPLITFFSLKSLLDKFQTAEKVRIAFDQLREKAIKAGFKGVSIAVSLGPDKKDIQLAEDCGIDILTGYNYHSAGFVPGKKNIPIENMQKGEKNIWDQFSKLTSLPYIPVTTLNWDPRPWATTENNYANEPYFIGLSANSVSNSVKACKNWILANSNNSVKEKIGLIYAWNEYGEGAYLTPTKDGENLLKGVKEALKD